MPRDYAKSQHQEHKPIPGWIWMLAGLSIGLFVALLVYINNNSSSSGKLIITETVAKVFQSKQPTNREKENHNATKPVDTSEKNKPKFDFYTILPELEVAIPEQELLNTKEEPDKTSSKTIQQYILQAGSFKKFEEADKLKARLAFQGIEANIQKVKINDFDTWHRVRIGPLNSIKALNNTRRRLRDLGIASIVVKNKS